MHVPQDIFAALLPTSLIITQPTAGRREAPDIVIIATEVCRPRLLSTVL